MTEPRGPIDWANQQAAEREAEPPPEQDDEPPVETVPTGSYL